MASTSASTDLTVGVARWRAGYWLWFLFTSFGSDFSSVGGGGGYGIVGDIDNGG